MHTLETLFDDNTEVKFQYRGTTVIYTYRHPDSKTWMEYQRKSSAFQVKKKTVTATDDTLGARAWLHEKMRVKVEVILSEGELAGQRQEVEDKFPAIVRDQAVIGYLSQVQPSEDDEEN